MDLVRAFQRLDAILRLTHNGDRRIIGQKDPQALAHDLMIIDDQYPNGTRPAILRFCVVCIHDVPRRAGSWDYGDSRNGCLEEIARWLMFMVLLSLHAADSRFSANPTEPSVGA